MKTGPEIQSELIGAMKQTLMMWFARSTPLETWGLVAVFIVAVMIAYKLTARACGAQPRSFMVLVPGFFLLLLTSAMVQVFWTQDMMTQLFVMFLALLTLVLPLTGKLQKTSWISSLLLWGVTVFVAAAVFYAESEVSQAVHRGAGSGSLYKRQHDQLDNLFKRTDK